MTLFKLPGGSWFNTMVSEATLQAQTATGESLRAVTAEVRKLGERGGSAHAIAEAQRQARLALDLFTKKI